VKLRIGVILVTLLAVSVVVMGVGYAGCGDGRGAGRGGLFGQLSEDQREAIHAKVGEMKDAGASREEIRDAVHEMLESWGIEVPEHPGRGRGEESRGERRHHPPFSDQLSEDQREAIHAMVKEMRGAGSSREEIRIAVRAMLTGWGVEVPERQGRGEHRGHRGEIFKQLTEEQRKAVHDRVREMRDADATPEEIHAAVREMLEGFGIELPEGENTRSATWGEIKSSYR
jgi:hypothetical protein